MSRLEHAPLAPLGPVVIGGLGGSATRVYAQLLRRAGYYLGSCLNEPCDNLWATLLLKRRYELLEDPQRARVALGLLRRKLSGEGRASIAEQLVLWRIARTVARHGHGEDGQGAGPWASRIARDLFLARAPRPGSYRGWGFKEPNAHVFLEHLAACYEDLRFVYVARHGLDMAFSSNLNQLRNWGSHYGVEVPTDPEQLPSAQLDYWIAATRTALERGRRLLGDRFLLVRYDELFPDPQPQLEAYAAFLGVEAAGFETPEARGWVQRSDSVGRYLERDLGQFTDRQLRSVEDLGFRVEASPPVLPPSP